MFHKLPKNKRMEEMFAKSCDKTTMQMKTLKEYKSGICFRYRHKNPSSK